MGESPVGPWGTPSPQTRFADGKSAVTSCWTPPILPELIAGERPERSGATEVLSRTYARSRQVQLPSLNALGRRDAPIRI